MEENGVPKRSFGTRLAGGSFGTRIVARSFGTRDKKPELRDQKCGRSFGIRA
jgi:hypothetical protein